MQIYNVGKDELNQYDLNVLSPEAYEWLVYEYVDYDGYSGGGMAVALRKDGQLQYKDLGHCSCYGPMSDWFGSSTVSIEEFFRHKDNIHDIDWSPALKSKVKELLG